jgi:hypothetical protein
MLRTVSKKVGQIYINTVGLQVFLRPARATHNNPPQRGGLKPTLKFRPERAMPIRFALPLYDYHRCIFFFFVFFPLKRKKYKKEGYNVP